MGCNCNKIIDGVVGLTQAVVGYNPADEITQNNRMNICRNCEYCSNPKLKFVLCTVCGCLLNAKIKNKSEKCPKNKW